jgi:hypothetical protein
LWTWDANEFAPALSLPPFILSPPTHTLPPLQRPLVMVLEKEAVEAEEEEPDHCED